MASPPPRTPFQGRLIGDSLRGDRILITARRLGNRIVINLSHDHKAQSLVARDQVYCVIELPLSARPSASA